MLNEEITDYNTIGAILTTIGRKARSLVSVELSANEEYKLRLPGAGSVGYVWSHNIEGPVDTLSVKIEAAQPTGGELRACSVDQIATITARKTGKARIHLALRRPFDKNAIREIRDIEVTVK